MSVKRYDFDCYAFYDSARLSVNECEDGDYVLHADYADLIARHNALKKAAVHIYNSGYSAGHHYTVEGSYVDIHSNDMNSYHAEEVAELLAALIGEERDGSTKL